MSLEEEDEFWNRSEVKSFNFDDDQPTQSPNTSSNSISKQLGVNSSQGSTPTVKTLGSILAARPSSNEPFLRPSMVACKANRIDQLIEHLDIIYSNKLPDSPNQDPKTYVRDIIDKKLPIDFSPYKSKREKLLLLDCAICCLDGNLITAAAIFLSRTLKSSLFIEEMKKRPVAVDHYVNYLELTGRAREASELIDKLQ